ncbi:MAG TPA: M48 family metallopeptidase [Armatimonadota bacterium]|nr:M48 family metallopeptidase [Armatimonadota bacterium]
MTVEQELQQSPPEPVPASFEFKSPAGVSFEDFIEERRSGRHKRDEELPSYAVPVDDDVRRTLNFIPFGHRIDDYLEKLIQVQIGPALHNAIRVSPRQFPRVYRAVDRCANRLGIAVPRVLVVPDVRIHSLTVGTSENHFIMLTSALVEKCTETEMTFLIGHECGHIDCRHLSYLALARALVEMTTNMVQVAQGMLIRPLQMLLQVPLAGWQRKAELTCDRAGLICAGDLTASLRALAKNVVQAPELAEKLDLDEYLQQLETSREESTLSKLPEYFAAIPFAPKRMKALTLFARSELYYDFVPYDKPPDLLTREDLEKQTDKVTSVL